jgi:hypothetical protein
MREVVGSSPTATTIKITACMSGESSKSILNPNFPVPVPFMSVNITYYKSLLKRKPKWKIKIGGMCASTVCPGV